MDLIKCLNTPYLIILSHPLLFIRLKGVRGLARLLEYPLSENFIPSVARKYVNLVNCLNNPYLIISLSHLHPHQPPVRELVVNFWNSSQSHLTVHPIPVSRRKCVNSVNCFVLRLFTWILWLQPFSNRLPLLTSKLNDCGWINCVTV